MGIDCGSEVGDRGRAGQGSAIGKNVGTIIIEEQK